MCEEEVSRCDSPHDALAGIDGGNSKFIYTYTGARACAHPKGLVKSRRLLQRSTPRTVHPEAAGKCNGVSNGHPTFTRGT